MITCAEHWTRRNIECFQYGFGRTPRPCGAQAKTTTKNDGENVFSYTTITTTIKDGFWASARALQRSQRARRLCALRSQWKRARRRTYYILLKRIIVGRTRTITIPDGRRKRDQVKTNIWTPGEKKTRVPRANGPNKTQQRRRRYRNTSAAVVRRFWPLYCVPNECTRVGGRRGARADRRMCV